jgi:hypothetical protein
VLTYPSTGGRPKTRRMLTETTRDQAKLIDIFNLQRWVPRTQVNSTRGSPRHRLP